MQAQVLTAFKSLNTYSTVLLRKLAQHLKFNLIYTNEL